MLTLTKIYAVKTGQPPELLAASWKQDAGYRITNLLKLICKVLNSIFSYCYKRTNFDTTGLRLSYTIQIISFKSFAGIGKLT
jgi:hypothetical protein